jgi:hypothetical protein
MEAEDIAGIHYQAMTGEDTADTDLVSAVVRSVWIHERDITARTYDL